MRRKGSGLAYIPITYPLRLNYESPQANGLVSAWNFSASRFTSIIKDMVLFNDAVPATTNYGWQETDNAMGTGVFVDGSAGSSTPCTFNAGNDASVQVASTGLTVCVWCRTYQSNGNTAFPGIVGKGDSDSSTLGSYLLFLTGTGPKLNYLDWSGSARKDSLVGATSIGFQSTCHLAATWQPSTRASIFVNGLRDATTTTSVPATLDNPNYNFLIGSNQGGATLTKYNFRGLIHEVRLYKRALSEDEIWQLYDPPTRWDLYKNPQRFFGKAIVTAPAAQSRSFAVFMG